MSEIAYIQHMLYTVLLDITYLLSKWIGHIHVHTHAHKNAHAHIHFFPTSIMRGHTENILTHPGQQLMRAAEVVKAANSSFCYCAFSMEHTFWIEFLMMTDAVLFSILPMYSCPQKF